MWLTRVVNQTLRTCYTVAELRELPQTEIDAIVLLHQTLREEMKRQLDRKDVHADIVLLWLIADALL